MPINHRQLIEKTLKTVINKYHEVPYNFFNEHEFHNYCFHVFYSKPEFNKLYESEIDIGKRTNILHPEYPSIKRFSREKAEPSAKGWRARYDLAILKPEFIKKQKMGTVTNRDNKKAAKDSVNLVAVVEFKYITKGGESFKHEIKYDHCKLREAHEAELKYMIVFSNTKCMEAEAAYIKEVIKNVTDINVAYIHMDFNNTTGKKILDIREYPTKWLLMPGKRIEVFK